MFAVDEAAAVIRPMFLDEGELFAIVELLQRVPWCRAWSGGA